MPLGDVGGYPGALRDPGYMTSAQQDREAARRETLAPQVTALLALAAKLRAVIVSGDRAALQRVERRLIDMVDALYTARELCEEEGE